jgi:hypothetical protein
LFCLYFQHLRELFPINIQHSFLPLADEERQFMFITKTAQTHTHPNKTKEKREELQAAAFKLYIKHSSEKMKGGT